MRLNRELLENNKELCNRLAYDKSSSSLPEKIIQFGEGNFLRAFCDWMINELNMKGMFNGRAVAVQPISSGRSRDINEQDGLYTLFLRGIENGQIVNNTTVISSLSRCINPYTNYEDFLKCAENPEVKYVISNTTEAGIAYKIGDRLEDKPASSFPGKLTQYLYHRFQFFNGSSESGMIIFVCELIERNGEQLRKIVMRYIEEWKLPDEFRKWVEEYNYFLTTLVDRIVPGYPKGEEQELKRQLGYDDHLMCTAEWFHLWVIEGPKELEGCIPFKEAGINVLWTNDVYPYKTRKVRLLNGPHIALVPVGLLYGIDTVGECINHPVIGRFIKKAMYEEIVPTIEKIDRAMLEEFAFSTEDRFKNPYIQHSLFSISLNGIVKFKERILPSIIGYKKSSGKVPPHLTFSIAAMIAFYKGEEINDNKLVCLRKKGEYQISDELDILMFFKNVWSVYESTGNLKDVTVSVLKNKRLWGRDLLEIEDLYEKVYNYLQNITDSGMEQAVTMLLENK